MIAEGLVDELKLVIHPLIIGKGKRLFADETGNVPLELTDSKTLTTGVVALTFKPLS